VGNGGVLRFSALREGSSRLWLTKSVRPLRISAPGLEFRAGS
jgi:hypothetical protein